MIPCVGVKSAEDKYAAVISILDGKILSNEELQKDLSNERIVLQFVHLK